MSETQRLLALRQLEILDTPYEERFDRITHFVARTFGCCMASIGFVDEARVWFKSCVGVALSETPREATYCQFVVQSDQPLVIEDAWKDPRYRNHPAAQADPALRFYVGYPLRAPDGSRIGSICAFDYTPHEVTPEQLKELAYLAAMAEQQLRLRALFDLQHELEASEQRYRALIERNPDAIYTLDPDGRFMSANEATCQLLGREVHEVLGQPFMLLIAPEDLTHTLECFSRCLEGETQHLQIRIQRADKSRTPVSVSASPHVVDGQLVGVVGVSRDISPRVAAEQRLDLALESSAQRVWDWDVPSGRLSMSGPLVSTLCPRDVMPVEEFLDPELSPIHPDDRAYIARLLQRLLEGETGTVEAEYRARPDRASTYTWVLIRGKVVERDEKNRPIRALGMLKDIHARKLAEQERQREAERLALAVRSGGVGIYEVDLDSGSIRQDARMNALFGWAPDAPAPSVQQVVDAIHPDDRARFRDRLEQIRNGAEANAAEHRVVWPDGSVRYLRFLGKALRLSAEVPRVLIGTCWDVTEAHQMQQQLSYQATHDALTGLYNRFEFERRLREVQEDRRRPRKAHALCFIDLDRFKIINDTAGHAAGDALLRELGQVLRDDLRTTDVVARLGGDEFGLLLLGCGVEEAENVARMLIKRIERLAFSWEGRAYGISASIGVTQFDAGTASIAELMSQADVACYAAKATGRGRVSVYQAEHSEAQQRHRQLMVASRIRDALEAQRFCLYAQEIRPTVPASDDPLHYELLVRMLDHCGSLISPGDFIPAAERYDLMAQIDRWVLREALERQAPRLAAVPGLTVALNLSAQSLDDPDFVPFVEALVTASALPAGRIRFEITETAAVTHLAVASRVIDVLHGLGCAVALDDFGSGLSSFNYLKHFRADFIKIDGSFIRSLSESETDHIIVESIHALASKLGARTIAEYVENDEILAVVRELGIDYAQGYGIGRPEPLDQVLGRLEDAQVLGHGAAQ